MARFSVSGGDDGGEGSSNHQSRKRQRLPSIVEEDAVEDSNASSSGEEDEGLAPPNPCNCRARRTESDDRRSTSDDSDNEVVIVEKPFEKSVTNNQSSSSKDSTVSVTLLDPDVLDCPICCEPLKIPIFQCDNGHLACFRCCPKVRNICPCCTLPIGYLRCRAMEKVVETSGVSCPNSKYGCKENILYANRSIHENLCLFTPCHCPIFTCNYTGYYKDLHNHVRTTHNDVRVPFVTGSPFRLSFDLNKNLVVLQELDEVDVMVIQVFRSLHGAYVTMSYIAPSRPGVERFSCRLENYTHDGVLKQGLMVKNVREVSYEQPEDGFMLVPSYLLGSNGNFDLEVSIGSGRDFLGN